MFCRPVGPVCEHATHAHIRAMHVSMRLRWAYRPIFGRIGPCRYAARMLRIHATEPCRLRWVPCRHPSWEPCSQDAYMPGLSWPFGPRVGPGGCAHLGRSFSWEDGAINSPSEKDGANQSAFGGWFGATILVDFKTPREGYFICTFFLPSLLYFFLELFPMCY